MTRQLTYSQPEVRKEWEHGTSLVCVVQLCSVAKKYHRKDQNSKMTAGQFFFLLINIFPASILAQLVQIDPNSSEEVQGTSGAQIQKLFAINVHLSKIPGDEVVIFGKERNLSDPYGGSLSVIEFLGVPFAKPPVGTLRFQRPSMMPPQKNFRALEEPSPCPQIATNGAKLGEEDCLYMNIYMSKKLTNATSKMPVLIWFHGESLDFSEDKKLSLFATGSAKELNPDMFLLNNVMVVTPQYRLGSLGYLSTSNEDLNGNMGLYDKLMALEWVRKYIDDFGGDSKQMTVMGHGSAAMEIGLLATSDLAKGLFQRAILMGGSPLSPLAMDPKPKSTFSQIALQNLCPTFPTLRFVRCMQQKSVESILRADEALSKGKHLGKMRMPLPIIQKHEDERFLPPILSNNPTNALTTGKFEKIPVIVGVSAAEMSSYLPSISGKTPTDDIASSIFLNDHVLKQFIRAILSRSAVDTELLSELISFEYFAGLNVTDPARHEQGIDITEEMVSDYMFHVPALTFAKLWSKFAPVYFYVFDYVSGKFGEDEDAFGRVQFGQLVSEELHDGVFQAQAHHASDIKFLMEGYEGTTSDRLISDLMNDLWLTFIHKGTPLHSGMPWPRFTEETKDFLSITKEPEILSGFHMRQEMLWTSVFENVRNHVCKPSNLLSSSHRRNFQGLLDSSTFFDRSTLSPNFPYF